MIIPEVTAPQMDVHEKLASVCGVLNASYAQLVTLVSQAIADESWAIAGVRSPEHWLIMRAGLSPLRARLVVQVARRAGELPSVMGEFAGGQLSVDQVAVVARYAPAHVEASAAEFAVHASVPQLRRSLSRYSFDPPADNGYHRQHTTRDSTADQASSEDAESVDPAGVAAVGTEAGDASAVGTAGDPLALDAATDATSDAVPGVPSPESEAWNGLALEPDRASAPAELSMSHDQYGRFILRLSAPADVGALVEAALKEARDALFKAGRPEVTWADGLSEVAARSLGSVTSINRRDAYRTYIHLDTDGAWLTGQPRLPTHLADKLTCDGILQPVWHTQGAPVNVGRAQRIVPTRTRRLVEDRDRGCRYPGCPSATHLECHHLIHWADGGPTDTWNLACLCPFHHDAHHGGDFTIKGDANDPAGLTFTTRSGFPIHPGPGFTTPRSGPERPTSSYRGPTGDSLNLRLVTFKELPDPGNLQTKAPTQFPSASRHTAAATPIRTAWA
jgi:hypothetical protein